MSLLVPRRRPSRELLDDATLAPEEMVRSLRDLERLNRRWGAARALCEHLAPLMTKQGRRPYVVLDIGAGGGSVARSLARGLADSGIRARVVAVDLQWRHLAAGRLAHDGSVPALAADAFRLPFPDGSADWAVSTLLLHHFSPEENVCLLRELTRVARRGIAMLDVRRHVFPLVFVAVAGRLAFEARVSVLDGQASVLQAYTPEEALDMARHALPGARVARVFPFRLLMTAATISPEK